MYPYMDFFKAITRAVQQSTPPSTRLTPSVQLNYSESEQSTRAEHSLMASHLPKGIEHVVIFDGKAYARISQEANGTGLKLRHGKRVSMFSPVAEGLMPRMNFPIISRPVYDTDSLVSKTMPPHENSQDLFGVWVNHLSEWALSNSETLQLMVADSTEKQRFDLASTIDVPALSNPQVFRALVASHRAQARLIVTVVCRDSGKETNFTQSFSNSTRGGVSASGYLAVEFRLPALPSGGELRMSLCYDAFVGEEHNVEPFLFLADPHVLPVDADPGLFSCLSFGSGTNGEWYVAPLPGPLQKGETLFLEGAGKAISLLKAKSASLQMTEEYGHSVMLQTDTPGNYIFYVDGVAAFKAPVGNNPTLIRLPAAYLDGIHKRLDVADDTGCQILFSTVLAMPCNLTPTDVLQKEGNRPFDGALAAQGRHRYEALKQNLMAGLGASEQAQLFHALQTVEGGYANVRLKPLVFPKVSKPDVSIVIPAHNKVEVTYLCLCSLLLARNVASFEVIVVDDASTDETAILEDFVSGITVVHNDQPQRFIRACNAGAGKARGTYVVLLNNDVEVTAGWLDELIDGFQRFDGVGAVGAKLLYPDGRLQDAGGIIWGSGNPWNYGNRQNPWAPEYCYARQVDYLSGAALMTTKTIWEEVGGLSSYLEPMYFEDTDFSFKVRDAGYKTYFIPSSVVYHYEGMTSGTDVASGFKRFQEVNRPKFKRRWVKAYAGFGKEGQRPDLEKDRGIGGRVLFIDYTTPRPDRDAGSYAAIQEIRLVQSLGYKVTFLPQNLAYFGGYTDELRRMGVEVICAPFAVSMQDYIEAHGADFDAFYITRYYTAQEVLPVIKKIAPQARVLFNNADLHFLRELRTALAEKDEEKLAIARDTRRQELEVMREVDVVLSYNESEHAVITSHLEGAVPVVKCPWVVDVPEMQVALTDRAGISFLGSFRHPPNVEGIRWFSRDVMPQISAAHPDLTLSIYGSGMKGNLDDIASDTVLPVGFVDEISDAFDRHRIFVAPLLSGAGIKGKVLSALAHGVPCVLTPTAAEGIGLRHGHDCFIVETSQDWSDAISHLSRDDEFWWQMSENARSFMRDSYSFAKGHSLMKAAFETVDLF